MIEDAVILECFRFAGDNVFATRFHADATVLSGTRGMAIELALLRLGARQQGSAVRQH